MRKEITVPAAGVSEPFSFTGRSILIEQAAGYRSFEDVPVLSFDVPGGQYPALTRSKYQNPQGRFNKIVVTGTDAAAGDSLVLVSVDACVDDFINFDSLITGLTVPGVSFAVASDDTAQPLPAASLVDSDGFYPSKILVSCTGNDIKFAIDATPGQGDSLGTVIRAGIDLLPIKGEEFIKEFEFISEGAGAPGTLTVHIEY